MNTVRMTADIVRGHEAIRYPPVEIFLRGVGHGSVQVIEYAAG